MSARVVPLPTPERVHALVRFDGKDFYWRPRPVSFFSDQGQWQAWTTKWSGKKIAIKHMANGYNGVRVDGALIMIHRLIWVLHYGAWPKGELDHINGDRLDNRIENLRDVSKSLNMRNQKRRRDNISGMPGVYWVAERRKWRVVVRTGGRAFHYGQFENVQDAIAARKSAQVKHGFTERHGEAT